MPTANTEIIKRELTLNAPADRIWACIAGAASACGLFASSAAAKLESDGAGGLTGKLRLETTLFKVRMRPYDALASAEGCRLALRLTPVSEGVTLVTTAVSCAKGCGFSASGRQLDNFLSRLAEACEAQSRTDEHGAKTLYKSAAHRNEAPAKADFNPSHTAHSERFAEESAPEKKKGGAWLAALGIIAAAAAAFAIWTFWPFGGAGITAAAVPDDLSEAVSEENTAELKLGMSRSEVEALFGTEGVKEGAGEYIYRSAERNGQAQPVWQIKAQYADDKLAAYTYLNLATSQQSGTIASIPLDLGVYGISMLRSYAKDGEEYLETHIGYLDPFANFSPSWRGEVSSVVNKATGATVTSYLKGYDGADPLMIGSLEGEAAAHQYDDYDAFLADKLAFDEARLMINRYSRGDAEAVFGKYESYDAGSGVTLYRVRKGELDENGEPIYSYSFRFDSTGAFEIGSFSNTRLYSQAGSLEGCKPADVAPGQSYGEVRYLMPIVPTALYVNDNFYTVCYGRYTGGTDIKFQFELVVSFDIATDIVEAVYDNSIPNTAPAA